MRKSAGEITEKEFSSSKRQLLEMEQLRREAEDETRRRAEVKRKALKDHTLGGFEGSTFLVTSHFWRTQNRWGEGRFVLDGEKYTVSGSPLCGWAP